MFSDGFSNSQPPPPPTGSGTGGRHRQSNAHAYQPPPQQVQQHDAQPQPYSQQYDGYGGSVDGGVTSQPYAGGDYQYNSQSSYADGYQDGMGYGSSLGAGGDEYGTATLGLGSTNGYYDQSMYEADHERTIYQQDAAVGDDAPGALNINHVPPPLPISHAAHPTLAKTVSSGVGPTYIPDGTLDVYGGEYRVVPVRTRLFASYQWALEGFSQAGDEKLVSLPFGPSNWRWQLVVYPKGAGDGAGSHISAFIRPLKNELETAAGDAWQRPINEFTIRVRRAIPGSPVVGTPDPADIYLVMDTSQSSFTGFSASMSGWGFPELLRITNVSDAVTYDGTLNIEADVVGDQVVDWAVYRHQWDIPSFLQLTEDETLSRPFGPPDCQWRMKIYRQGHREGEGSHFSAYIIPEKSEREHALGLAWTRPIVSLTVKIQTGNSAEPLMTKTITGGWLFRDDNLECGWSQLLELGRLTETMDWYATLSIVTEVTWDLSYDSNETDLGRVKETLSASVKEVSAIKGRFDALSQELDSSRAEAVEMKSQLTTLHADFTAAQEDNQQLTEQLRKVEARLQTLRNIEARMAVMQKEILAAQTRVEQAEIIEDRFSMVKDELAVARENQEHADALKLKVAETRARLAALRAGMEEGSALPASETEEVSQDLETMKAKVLRMQSKMHDLERDLVEARSEVDSKSRALADAAILAPVAEDDKADSIGEDASVLVRLQTVRNEILVVRGVLLEVEDRPIDSPAARASLSAELAMVQAELEVTRATFVGLTTQYVDEIEAEPDLAIEANIVATELQEVRTAMSSKRASLEEDADQPEAELTSQDRATSPIRQFPPSMQLPHATASDFGVTRTAARDAADPVPLPAGVLPPPTDLDAASHPVPNHNSHHLLLRAEEEAATAARELSFVRHERDCLQAELEETRQRMQEAREELVKNNTEVNTQGVMESLFGRRMSQSQPHLNPDYRDDHESWTPVEGHFSGVNSKNLSARLSHLQPQRRLLPTLLGITTTFITCWFMLYSAVYVACSPSHLEARPNALYQNVCNKAVLPAWTTVIDTWHGAAERFVFDVAPGVGETVRWTVRKSKGAMRNVRQRLESATASNEQVIDRNVILPGGDAGEPSTVTRSSAETRSTISSVARSEPAHSSVPENLTTPLPDVRVKPPAEQDERADMPRRDLGASSGDESLSEHLKQDSGRDEALPEEITFATGPPSESALPVKTPNTHSVEISSEPLSTLTIDHSKPAATHPHDIGEQPTTPVSAQEAQVPGNAVAPDPADLTDAPETEHQNGTPSGDVLQPSMEAVSPDLEANPHPMSIPDLPLPSAEFLTPVSVEPIASPSQSSQHDATDTASEGDLNSNNDGAAEGSPVEAVEEAAENEEEVHHDEADTGDEDGQHDEEIHNDIFPPASDQIPAVTYPDDVAAGNANEIDAAETAHGWDASDTPASEKAEPATKHVSDEL